MEGLKARDTTRLILPYDSPEFVATETSAPADWLVTSLFPPDRSDFRVRHIVPMRFSAYARILPPVIQDVPGEESVRVRWADIALANGRTLSPESRFRDLSDQDDRGNQPGDLPIEQWSTLAGILSRFTDEMETCYFALWSGHGQIGLGWPKKQTSFSIPRDNPLRTYFLFRGPLGIFDSISDEMFLPPEFLWPESRSWLAASDTDLKSTFVGGPERAIRDILASRSLEAVPTRPEASVD